MIIDKNAYFTYNFVVKYSKGYCLKIILIYTLNTQLFIERYSMEVLKGIPVSPGFAIGEAFVLGNEESVIPRRFISVAEIDDEFDRFHAAVENAKTDIRELQEKIRQDAIGSEAVPIFDAHVLILDDASLHQEVLNRISKNRFSAEYAVSRSLRKYEKAFAKIDDEYLAQRISDLHDIERRLLRALLGERKEDLKQLDRQVIVIAHDLTPTQTASMDREHVIGFSTDVGGMTGHTAIIARSRELPAVVGLETVTSDVSSGDKVIIDGNRGLVIVNPDVGTLETYEALADDFHVFEESLIGEKDLPAETIDGKTVRVSANLEFPSEIGAVGRTGGDGVGLYRTEFLYVNSETVPDEDAHWSAYKQAVEHLPGQKVTIRTLDLGADKFFHLEKNIGSDDKALLNEKNPALGCRAIRYCARHPKIFKAQVRAICRASALGRVNLMVPMVSCREEVEYVIQIVRKEQEILDEDGIDFDPTMPIGIMVEVPSVAIDIENYLDLCDFFSIGTNDLTQYVIAVDRTNEHVANLYSPTNPAVLKLIHNVIKCGAENNKPVSICGEIAGDPSFTFLLLGMGLSHFSVSPPLIPEIKKLIRSITMTEAEGIVEEVMKLKNSREITTYLRNVTRKYQPDWSFN